MQSLEYRLQAKREIHWANEWNRMANEREVFRGRSNRKTMRKYRAHAVRFLKAAHEYLDLADWLYAKGK